MSSLYHRYTEPLSSGNENPVNSSTATGYAIVTVDTIQNTMNVQVTFSGLTMGDTASHIHCCIAPGGNVGVATTLPTFTNFPSGVTNGTYNNTFDLTLASSYNPAFVTASEGTTADAEAALLAGLAADDAYLNIHTTQNPSGEIRGFLVASPEPATSLLAGLALAGFALKRRQSRVMLKLG